MLLKLTNNWTSYFLRIPSPSTVDEAVERLTVILSDSEKLTLANTPEQDLLINLHFSLGLSIRNGFELHRPDNRLVIEYGNADDASMQIIHQLWKQLNEK
jgi:hypothetical protein